MIANIIGEAIISALEKKHKDQKYSKPISFLIETINKDPLELYQHFKKRTKFLKNLEKDILEYLFDKDPAIDLTFWEVLLKTLYPGHKMNAIRWLQGDELSEEDLKKLGIRHSIENQAQALRILSTVLTLSPLPILLSFDQLETLQRPTDEIVLKAFFDILVTLHGHTSNCVILLLIQSSVWNILQSIIQKSALDRIQDQFTLVTPTEDQLVKMISSRMGSLWDKCSKDPPPYESYPFREKLISNVGRQVGYNPRTVLQKLAEFVDEMKEKGQIAEPGLDIKIEPDEVTDAEVGLYLRERIDDFVLSFSKNKESYPPSSIESFIRDVLYHLFHSVVEMKAIKQKPVIDSIIPYRKSRDLDYLVHFQNQETKENNTLGVQVTNTDNGRSFFSRIENISRKIQSDEINKWILLRNRDLAVKTTWKRSHEILNEIGGSGDIKLLDFDTIALLLISKELLDSASAGDLSIGTRIITRDEVILYLANSIFIQNNEIIDLLNFSLNTDIPLKEPVVKENRKKPFRKENSKKKTMNIKNQILQMLVAQPILASKKIATALRHDHTQIYSLLDFMESDEQISVMQRTEEELYVMRKSEDVFE